MWKHYKKYFCSFNILSKKSKNLSENKKLNKIEIIEPKNFDLNPEGPYSEIYKKNILLGQKILIVMTYK